MREGLFWSIYLAGCILSFGRGFAGFYEISEKYIKEGVRPLYPYGLFFISMFSWLSLFILVAQGVFCNDKYLFKWSNKGLWDIYWQNNTGAKNRCRTERRHQRPIDN